VAKYQEIEDEELRDMMGDAYACMRRGSGGDAVRKLAETLERTVEKRPSVLRAGATMRGRRVPMLMRWPGLGANLDLRALRSGKLEIVFARERFAVSEAMTYYEFLLDVILRGEQRAGEKDDEDVPHEDGPEGL